MIRAYLNTAGIFLLLLSPSANADLFLDLVTADSTTVLSGSSVSMNLILRDTDNSHFGPLAGPGATSLGLLTGGGKLIASGSTGAGSAAITSTVAGADFSGTTPQDGTSLLNPGLGGALSLVNFPAFPPAGIATGIAHIATFMATVTGNAGDSITISADTLGLNPAGTSAVVGNQVFGTFTNLDAILGSFASPGAGSSFGSITFNVAAVPEPSTMFVAALMAGVGFVVWRRRQKVVVSE